MRWLGWGKMRHHAWSDCRVNGAYVAVSSSTHFQIRLLLDFAVQCGCCEDECTQIELAVRETVINAIVHGNCCDPEKRVHIDATLSEHELAISIRDEGAGFDPAKVADPTKPENLMRDSGRGILMMQTLMDEVTINSAPGQGTEVRMVKGIAGIINKKQGEEQSMSLKIASRQVDGVTVLDFEGRIVLGEPKIGRAHV